jgi:hypothetical protein
MANLLIEKPDAGEHAPYFSRYIDLVPAGDVLGVLRSQIDGTLAELRGISDVDSLRRYAEGKWSVREVVGHLADAERIFAYRALRFARKDRTPLAGFEENDYVPAARFDARDWGGLIEEYGAVRRSSLYFFEGLDGEAWERRGVASGKEISVRALAYIMAGHELHHMRILRERYR